ncbi:uncharacterized protein [Mytilus edulis]|uniref:uncharacterized protein isoform X2 n=1 Tax=Mytilus edulis TaxID=6550 RepID=UPI0039F0FAF1
MLFRFLILVHFCAAFPFKCPEPSQWSIRARSYCPDPSKYSCLKNDLIHGYSENCTIFDFLQPGRKNVLRGGLDADICSIKRYQPWPIVFYTNVSTNCIFLKSACNEEGQVVFDNGNRSTDASCRCDDTRRYDSIVQPRNPCVCVPSEEDCSCFLKMYHVLSPDSKRNKEFSMNLRFLTNERFNISQEIQTILFDNFKYNIACLPTNEYRIKAIGLVLTLVLSYPLVTGLYILQRRLSRQRFQIFYGYLPEAMKRLTDADKKRYNQMMQSTKTEKRYFARIMIVGQDKVGKTTLLRRLLKDSTAGVSSTDGVDIAIDRCKIDIESGKWTIGKDISDNKADRIKRAENYKQFADTNITVDDDLNQSDISRGTDSDLKSSIRMADNPCKYVTDDRHVNHIDNVSTSSHGSKVSLDTVDQIDTKGNSSLANIDSYFNKNEHEEKPSSLIMPDDLVSNVFSKTPNSNDPANLHALCGLWDFAGQREFYATHQAFLTKNAVYLVVANMEEDICKKDVKQCFAAFPDIGEYVDFWFDSIHCHAGETTNLRKDFSLDPPIIVVFTCKDKYKEELLGKKREEELKNKLNDVLERQGKYHHLRNIHFVSNMDKSDKQFEQLRQDISGAVKLMNNWGEPMPVVWILLEHLIEINKKNGMNFTNLSDIVKMAKHPEINIVDINIVFTFLRFQHKEGNIIFFDDIHDLIILNPKWLVDAFRCLVSDKIDADATLQHLHDWSLLKRSGKASDYLISQIFQSETKRQFFKQKEDLLKVMEKFDILIKIEGTSYYIMPSKMPSLSFDKVCDAIGVENPNCNRTSWICLKFEFLPPAFFNHLSAWFIQKYKGNVDESPHALYRGICIFDTDRSGCKKVFLAMSTNTIAIQLLSFSTETPEFGSTCSILCQELITKVKDITKRYQLTLDFEIHFKCSKGHYHTDTKSYMQLIKNREFFCADHKEAHQSELIYSPWMMHHAYKNWKRKFNLDVEKHLKIGLEVGVGKIPIYKNKYTYIHHGIVITISEINKTFEMVALTGGHKTIPSLIGKNIEPVIETTTIKFTSKDLFYFDYNQLSDKAVTIKKRAEALVSLFVKSGVKYNLREFNCDHFASYCSTGLAFSGQMNRVNLEATDKLDKILEQC